MFSVCPEFVSHCVCACVRLCLWNCKYVFCMYILCINMEFYSLLQNMGNSRTTIYSSVCLPNVIFILFCFIFYFSLTHTSAAPGKQQQRQLLKGTEIGDEQRKREKKTIKFIRIFSAQNSEYVTDTHTHTQTQHSSFWCCRFTYNILYIQRFTLTTEYIYWL
jgi:hypothetical protein